MMNTIITAIKKLNVNINYKFHPQQIEMAENIIKAFQDDDKGRYALLLAQMQSGKSGTYLLTSLLMFALKLVDKVYVICGSRDTALRAQTVKNTENAISEFKYIIHDLISKDASNKEYYIDILKSLDDFIDVVFNQDLKKRIKKLNNRTLIVNDESHYAQAKFNKPYKDFWKKHGLNKCICGDMSVLKEKDLYVLNVSATPFAEFIQNERVKLGMDSDSESDVSLEKKQVFIMKPAPSYMGVKDFHDKGLIKYIERKDRDFRNFAEVIDNEKFKKKYMIVRLVNTMDQMELIETIARSLEYDCIDIFQDSKHDFGIFNKEPENNTIVAICGKCRMGQDFCKDYVGLVYEPSINVKTDTCLQGLLGRMCGYHTNDIDIYISSKASDEVNNYIRNEFHSIQKATYVKVNKRALKEGICKDKDGKLWSEMVPIKIPYNQLERGFDGRTPSSIDQIKKKPNIIENFITDNRMTHKNATFIKKELVKWGLGRNGRNGMNGLQISNLTNKCYSRDNLYDVLDNAVLVNRTEHFSGSNYVTSFNTKDVKPFIIAYHEEKKCLFIVGFALVEQEDIPVAVRKYKISKVDKKANYVWTGEEDDEERPQGQAISFSKETCKCKNMFKSELRAAVERSQSTDPLFRGRVERCLTSNGIFDKYIVLEISESKIKTIKKELEQELSIKFSMKKRSGRKPNDGYSKDAIRYKSISW